MKQLLAARPGLKVILMSATLQSDRFADYFEGRATVVSVKGRTFPVGVESEPRSGGRGCSVLSSSAAVLKQCLLSEALNATSSYTVSQVVVYCPGQVAKDFPRRSASDTSCLPCGCQVRDLYLEDVLQYSGYMCHPEELRAKAVKRLKEKQAGGRQAHILCEACCNAPPNVRSCCCWHAIKLLLAPRALCLPRP
jgi:hypothetical protein